MIDSSAYLAYLMCSFMKYTLYPSKLKVKAATNNAVVFPSPGYISIKLLKKGVSLVC
jgi:hypothetical protein